MKINATSWKELKKQLRPLQGKAIFELERIINISRLESGNYNPSLDFLAKVAESLEKSLSVQLM